MDKITVEHKGQKYLINLDKARELGLLESQKRLIGVRDIPNGSIFRWIDVSGETRNYVMLDNSKYERGQCVRIDIVCFGELRGFAFDSHFSSETDYLEYFNPKTGLWVKEVE